MLVLTRKRGESVDLIVEGNVIATIKVLEFLPNDGVRLGFDADPQIEIVRDNVKSRPGMAYEPNGNR